MNNLNSVLIEGNLVRDPQVRQTPRGRTVCNFTIASVKFYRGESGIEKEVCFFDIESWGKFAENCQKIGRKGRSVRVVGRLRQDRWIGEDGKLHTRIVIVTEHIEFRPEFNKEKPADYTAEELECFAENGELPAEEEIEAEVVEV